MQGRQNIHVLAPVISFTNISIRFVQIRNKEWSYFSFIYVIEFDRSFNLVQVDPTGRLVTLGSFDNQGVAYVRG